MLKKVLPSSRFFILIAVIGAFAASATLLVYGLIEGAALILSALREGGISRETGRGLSLGFIEMIDMFLLGTVFYIISLGLYELFIDDRITLLSWLEIHDLDDLKNKLVRVVIVVLAVLFLGQVTVWDGETNLLGFGAAIALVIGALTLFLGYTHKGPAAPGREEGKE